VVVVTNLCGNDEKPRSKKGDAPSVKSFDNVDDTNRVGRPGSESASGVGEYGNEDVLLHVKRARVEGEFLGPEPGKSELGFG